MFETAGNDAEMVDLRSSYRYPAMPGGAQRMPGIGSIQKSPLNGTERVHNHLRFSDLRRVLSGYCDIFNK